MKKIVLENIEGVEIYPIISLLIFVTLFTGVIIYALKIDKKLVSKIAALPFDNNETTENHEHIK